MSSRISYMFAPENEGQSIPTVRLYFSIQQDMYHASSLYAGLDALASRGAIALEVLHPSARTQEILDGDPLTILLEIRTPEIPEPRLMVIDLRDRSDLVASAALDACDVYFKRSFNADDLADLPLHLSQKIASYGLNYACRTWGSTNRLLRTAAVRLAMQGVSGFRRLRHHFSLALATDFEQLPTVPLEPAIVFHTRVWQEYETSHDGVEEINEQRVELIRALKGSFGPQFIGGLIPTFLAMTRYPREVSTHPTQRRRNAVMKKRSLIGVYSRGLHGSTAFKMPEYMAGSQCIVAQPPQNQLPRDIICGKHFLPFETPNECIAACERLLADDRLATIMRQSNYTYYRSEVEPAAHFVRLLERSMPIPQIALAAEVA